FRITIEFFREPDIQLGFMTGGLTMGQLLSVPMVVVGAWLVWRACRLPDDDDSAAGRDDRESLESASSVGADEVV
ncbi:MAG: prolipoprotein diacylglyceryl transferase, partial [Coriobacteriia bacterium]|nr:prolipoprotein diacylglyceryl transferase [Coriobacteriia bacterium]